MSFQIMETKSVNPHLKDRWVIKMVGIEKQHCLKYKIKTFYDSEKMEIKTLLKIEVLNTFNNLYLPNDFITKKIRIEFLDVTGLMVDYMDLKVNFNNLVLDGEYGNISELSKYVVEYWVTEISNLREEKLNKKALTGYLENKKEEINNDKKE